MVNNKEHLIYCAGLFDGEGSAGVYSAKHQYGLVPTVQLAMTDKAPVKFFADTLGFHLYKNKKKTKSGKAIWRTQVTCQKALKAATLLLLFVKNPAKTKQLKKIVMYYRQKIG